MWRRLLVGSLVVAFVAAALPPLTVTPYPRTSFAPATVRLRIHITPDPSNRWLAWGCDGGDYFTQESELRIDGDQGPTLFVRDLRDLYPGDYTCQAVVTRQDGSTLTATAAFVIIAP